MLRTIWQDGRIKAKALQLVLLTVVFLFFLSSPVFAQTAEELLQAAETHISNAEHDQAIQTYQAIIAQNPGTDHALSAQKGIAMVYIQTGNDSAAGQAIDMLKTEYSQDPNMFTNVYALANEYWELTKFDKAKELYQYVSQNGSDSDQAIRGQRWVVGCQVKLDNDSGAGQAINTLKTNYSQHKNLFPVIYEIANEYWELTKFDKAKELYQYVSQNSSDSDLAVRSQRWVVGCEVKLDNDSGAAQAINTLKTDFSQHKNLFAVIYELANEYWYIAKFDKAKDLYQYVADNCPDSGLAIRGQTWVAGCESKLGNDSSVEQSIDMLKTDYSEDPNMFTNMYALANEYWEQQKYDKAKELYQYVSDNSSDSDQAIRARRWVVGCEARLGNDSGAGQAINTLKTDFSQHKNLFPVIYELANEYWELQKFDKAKDLYRYVSENCPDSSLAIKGQTWVAGCEIKSGNDSAAEQASDTLCTKYSSAEELVDVVLPICNLFIQENDPAMALQYINRALQASPDHEKAIWLLKTKADCYVDMAAVTQADAVVAEIVQNHSTKKEFAIVLNGIADSYRKRGNHTKSIELRQQVLNNNPDVNEQLCAQTGIGMNSVWLGDDAKAQAKVDLIVANYKDHPRAGYSVFVVGEEYYFKAREYLKSNNQDLADSHFQKAFAIWDSNINQITDSYHKCLAYYYSATAYQYMKDYEKAIVCYQKVVDQWPKYKFAWNSQYLIASCYDQMCDTGIKTKAEVKEEILDVCQKMEASYPDSPAIAGVAILREKYNSPL